MKRKLLSILTLLCLTVSSAWAWSGSGTNSDPYQITSTDDLATLRNNVNNGTNYSNKYFKQTADIALSGNWTPIGTETNPFKGHYDGGNFTIRGLNVSGSYQYAGLFGYITSERVNGNLIATELKNIRIVDCTISVGSVTSSKAGAIAGRTGPVHISDCRVSGSITGNYYAGGLIGYIEATAYVSVTNSFVDVSVTATNQYNRNEYLMAYVSGGSPTASGNYCHGSGSTGISATSLYMVKGVPSGVTVAETNATVTYNDKHYFAANATATLTVDDANHTFNTFSVSGASSYNVASDKKSATVTLASSDASVSATLKTVDGSCGTNATWAMIDTDNNGTYETLTISGTGAMYNYSGNNAPWNSYKANITTVVIGNGVTSIGNYAFYDCRKLASVTIPASVTSIGESAFYDCTGLTSIEIPASVTRIRLGAFAGCTSLASISVTSGNSTYHSDGNCIIETATNKLIAGCKNSVIPTGVTSIGNYAFSGCESLTSITIPNSVTSIGYYAFSGCTGLTSITIPNSVTSIGNYAFYDCDGLASIEIPNSVTSIGQDAFYNCKSLTSIEIPASVTSIGYEVFANCKSLASITIPNGVTSIGVLAFRNCNSLTSIEIPASVTSIGESAFYGCSRLASVTIYAPSLSTYCSFAFDGNASLHKIYVFSDRVDTYREKASELGVYENDIRPITLTANPGDNAGEYWTTYYNDLAHAKVPSGAQAFKVTLSGTTLALTPISDGIITKGTGVVIKSTSDSILPESSASASSDTNANSLTGTMKTITNPGNAYVLSKGNAGVGFYRLKDTGTIGAHKAYLTYSSISAPEFFGFGDETAIDNVTNSQQPANNEYYDLQGRKVTNPTKGLYIVNGKIVVKK